MHDVLSVGVWMYDFVHPLSRFWPHSGSYDSLFNAVASPLHTDIALVRESTSGIYLDYCEVSGDL